MEVLVNGDLAAAADGQAFGVSVLGDNGIKEHAKLFGTAIWGSLVNAAAVWQVASVIVAQKAPRGYK